MTRLTELGRVAKPHGVRGEARIISSISDEALLRSLPEYRLVGPENACRAVHALTARPYPGGFLVRYREMTSPEDVAQVRGWRVMASSDHVRGALGPSDVYVADLPGRRILLRGGELLGSLEDVLDMGGQEVWRILTPDGREVLFVAHAESVLRLEPGSDEAVIDPPPGLLDMYLAPDKGRF